jgi:helix-turn-helix protein
MGKFQNVNFEKLVVLKITHDYNNKIIVPQLFKILRLSTCASVLKIENFIVEVMFQVGLQSELLSDSKNLHICIYRGQFSSLQVNFY